MSAAVEQSRRKANMVAQETGNSAHEADPRILPNQKSSKQSYFKKSICPASHPIKTLLFFLGYESEIPNGAGYHACGVVHTKNGQEVVIAGGKSYNGPGTTRIYNVAKNTWTDTGKVVDPVSQSLDNWV